MNDNKEALIVLDDQDIVTVSITYWDSYGGQEKTYNIESKHIEEIELLLKKYDRILL